MEGDSTRPWYFLHIPKTAGTTFRVLLENCFHMDEICPAYEFFQIKQYSPEQLARFQLFRGHMGYNLVHYLPRRPRLLVVLRNPMERTVSHFDYIRRDPSHPKYGVIHERKLGLKEYLLDPVLSAEVTHAQVRPLAHTAEYSVLRELLGGSDSQASFARAWRHRAGVLPPDDELLGVALQRLEKMDFVGTAEQLPRGLQLAGEMLGAHPQQQLQSLNINPRRTRLEALPGDVLELLEQVTALDRQLYARGKALFEAQYQRMVNGHLQEQYRHASLPCRNPVRENGNSLVFDFSQPLCGSGWHQRELVPGQGVLRWSGPENYSYIDVPLQKGQGYRLKITLADWVGEEVLRSLAISVNDVDLPVSLVEEGQMMYAQAEMDASTIKEDQPFVRIGLRFSRTQVLPAADHAVIDHSHARKVGIAVYRFEFTRK